MIRALIQQLLLLSGDVDLNPGPALDLDSTPTLRYLAEMKVDGKPLEIIQKIAALNGYLKFGMHLLQHDSLEGVCVIEKDHKGDGVENVVCAMIEKWLASSGAPRTYRHLIECLKLSVLNVLADDIANYPEDLHPKTEVSIKNHQALSRIPIVLFLVIFFAIIWQSYIMFFSSSTLPESLVEYQRYLTENYKTDPYPLYSSPFFTNHHPHYPINLVLVHRDKDQTNKVSIQEQELLFHGKVEKLAEKNKSVKIEEIGSLDSGRTAAHFVLIEGDPGIGKSTLCWQLCRLWSEGTLQHEWDLMVIIELRDEATRKARELDELFYHPSHKARPAIARDIEEREGKGLLIFLDGYDELSKFQRSEFLVIRKILTNKLLSKATIVVTSRPTAILNLPPQFKERLQQHIKIAGFTKTDIQSYVTSACEDDLQLQEDFRSYVFNNSFILSVMYNPLHCAIVTEIYIDCWKDGRKGFVPTTITELYKSLVFNLVRHNMPADYSDIHLETYSDLPKFVNNQLMKIAEFAANKLIASQYVFTEAPDEMLGLMVPVKKLNNKIIEGRNLKSYIFLHLTLQEYLAALYWSKHPDQLPTDLMEPITIINIYHSYDDERHWPLLLFMAGLTNLEPFPSKYLMSVSNSMLVCKLLFEAKSPQLVGKMFTNKTIEFVSYLSSVDYFALAYCIINSGNTTTWRLHRINYELADNFQNIGTANWDETTGPSIELIIENGFCFNLDVFLIHLFPYTKSVSELDCHRCPFFSIEQFSNIKFVNFPSLKALSLPYIKIEPQHETVLANIELSKTLISIRLYSSFSVLLSNLNQLNELHIIDRDHDDLCIVLSRFNGKRLKVLELHSWLLHFISDLCLERITKLLSYGLEQLTLSNVNVSNSAFDEINSVIASSQLKKLNYYFRLNIEKAKSLGKLLTKTATLEEVSARLCYQEYDFECNVVRIIVDTMEHSGVKRLYLQVHGNDLRRCIEDILNLKDRVVFDTCRNLFFF